MVTLSPNDLAMLIITIALIGLPMVSSLYEKIVYDLFARKVMKITRVDAYQMSQKDLIIIFCQIPWIILSIIITFSLPKKMREDFSFLAEKRSEDKLEKLRLEDYQEERKNMRR